MQRPETVKRRQGPRTKRTVTFRVFDNFFGFPRAILEEFRGTEKQIQARLKHLQNTEAEFEEEVYIWEPGPVETKTYQIFTEVGTRMKRVTLTGTFEERIKTIEKMIRESGKRLAYSEVRAD